MVKTNKMKLLVASLAFLGVTSTAHAQLEDAGEILRAGAADANVLLGEYLKPFGRGFGAGLNSGWVGVAKPHSFLGFDVTIRATMAQVPTADQSFDLQPLVDSGRLTNIRPMNANNTVTPTISGDGDGVPVGLYSSGGQLLDDFEMPPGTEVPYVPTPMVQASVGVLFNTDVTLRFVPETELGDAGTISLFGLGVKHDIGQWIPVVSAMPIDVMAFYGFTNLKTSATLNVRPENPAPANTQNPYPDSEWDGQEIQLESSGTNMGIIVGKSLPLISVYGGIGRSSSTTDILTVGNYPVIKPDPVAGNPTRRSYDSIADPVNLSMDGANKTYAMVGGRLKLLLLTFSADYTIAEYNMLSVGVGISFR